MHKGHITYQITVFHSIYISRQIYKYTKMDLPDFLKVAIPLVVAPVGGALLFKHHFAGHNNAKRLLTFKNLDECVDELEKIQQASSIDIERLDTLSKPNSLRTKHRVFDVWFSSEQKCPLPKNPWQTRAKSI